MLNAVPSLLTTTTEIAKVAQFSLYSFLSKFYHIAPLPLKLSRFALWRVFLIIFTFFLFETKCKVMNIPLHFHCCDLCLRVLGLHWWTQHKEHLKYQHKLSIMRCNNIIFIYILYYISSLQTIVHLRWHWFRALKGIKINKYMDKLNEYIYDRKYSTWKSDQHFSSLCVLPAVVIQHCHCKPKPARSVPINLGIH